MFVDEFVNKRKIIANRMLPLHGIDYNYKMGDEANDARGQS